VPLLADAWVAAARARRRLQRARGAEPPGPEELVRRVAPGRTFADVGALWGVHGRLSFVAEEAGVTRVTALDVIPATPEFTAERERRGSAVRLVQGDLHDAATLEAVGVHDVVWCAGVLYHAPHPLLTLERLHAITGETLVLSTATIPEIPGLRQAALFLPRLGPRDRRALARAYPGTPVGLATPFTPEQGYANWWWALTPSAVRAMLAATGFEVVETLARPFSTTVLSRRAADMPTS
jgi:hypothetical protein